MGRGADHAERLAREPGSLGAGPDALDQRQRPLGQADAGDVRRRLHAVRVRDEPGDALERRPLAAQQVALAGAAGALRSEHPLGHVARIHPVEAPAEEHARPTHGDRREQRPHA